MSISRILISMGMLTLGLVLGTAAARDFRQVWVIDPDRFAAIAYSPSTGKYGYSYNYRSRSAAETAALGHLSQPDARIVCWVKAGFCALAKGDDNSEWGAGWSYGKGARTEDAKEAAVEDCEKKTTHPYLALLLLSDGQLVWDGAPHGAAAQENLDPGADFATKTKPRTQSSVGSATTPVQPASASPAATQIGKLSSSMMQQLASVSDEKRKRQSSIDTGKTKESATTSSWQTSWDAFVTSAEQELNQSSANATPVWEGKEVTWEGTVNDMEVMTAKNLIRLVFDMPEHTLTIKGQPISAGRLIIFVPMQYENLAAARKGATVPFKTTIASVDATHPSVSAQPGKNGAKGFLLIFTKGGTLLK